MKIVSFLIVALCIFSYSVVLRGDEIIFSRCPLFTDALYQGSQLFNRFISKKQDHELKQQSNSLNFHLSQQFFGIQNNALIQEITKKHISNQNEPRYAECATPLFPFKHGNYENYENNKYYENNENYEKNDDRKIRMFIKRLSNNNSNNLKGINQDKKALFLLSGGPGDDASYFEPIMAELNSYLPTTDIYYLEHRGVGRSSRLGCEESQAETRGSEAGVAISINEDIVCAHEFEKNYENNTDAFSTTQAAYDLKYLIQQVKDKYSGGIIIYAISYGTFWANRFLQLDGAPNGVTQVILDGVVSPKSNGTDLLTRTTLTAWDHWMNIQGLDFMDFCDKDQGENSCASLLKKKIDELNMQRDTNYEYKNGKQFIELVFKEVFENNKCKSQDDKNNLVDNWGFSRYDTEVILADLLANYQGRDLIPALLFRLLRCNDAEDYPIFKHIRQYFEELQLNAMLRDSPRRSSSILGLNIMLNELWDESIAPTIDDLFKQFNQSYFGSAIFQMFPAYKAWKKYDESKLNKNFENINIPILMINGDMDPQTPFIYSQTTYNQVKESCPNTKLIKIPYAPHFSLLNSLYYKVDKNRPAYCGMDLVVQFIQNGNFDNMDLTCTDRIIPPLVGEGKSEASKILFGVFDKWNGILDEDDQPRTVSLYLFIAVEVITILIGAIIIGALVYAIVRFIDKQAKYDNLLDEEHETIQ